MSWFSKIASVAAPVVGTAIGGPAALLAGAGLGTMFGREDDRETQQQLWNETNSYNSPAAQKQRFLDAGLNPNLMMGQGGNAGSATSVPQQISSTDSASTNRTLDNLMGMMQLNNQIELLRAQADKAKADAAYAQANTQKTIDYEMPQIKEQTRGMEITNDANQIWLQKDMQATVENLASQTLNNQSNRKLIEENVGLVAQQILTEAARRNNINMDTKQMKAMLPFVIQQLKLSNQGQSLSNANESDILTFMRTPANKNVPLTNRNYNFINMLHEGKSNAEGAAAGAKSAGVNANWANFNQIWNKATDVTNSAAELGGAVTNYKNMRNNANQGEVRNGLFRQQLNRTTFVDRFDSNGNHVGSTRHSHINH